MNGALRIALIVALALYYFCIFCLLKRKSLTLKYTLLWILTGIVMLLIVLFPGLFEGAMHAIGIVEMTNGLFAVVLFAVIIILVSITSIVSRLNDRIRQLIQQCAMYEKRIREMEEKIKDFK